MEPEDVLGSDQEILHLLQPGERVTLGLAATNEELRVTDRRLFVTTAGYVRLQIPYERLRRIEFDIESGRPATMIIVTHLPSDEPQVLAIPHQNLHRAADVLAFVGERLP